MSVRPTRCLRVAVGLAEGKSTLGACAKSPVVTIEPKANTRETRRAVAFMIQKTSTIEAKRKREVAETSACPSSHMDTNGRRRRKTQLDSTRRQECNPLVTPFGANPLAHGSVRSGEAGREALNRDGDNVDGEDFFWPGTGTRCCRKYS